MGSRFDRRVLIVDAIIDKDRFPWLELVFLIALTQPIDLGGIVHELAVLYAFDGEEVGDRGKDFIEVSHLGIDIKGG